MSRYTIGEVAERSGFPATALRYYEGIGLVAPTGRTAAGYRLYDDEPPAIACTLGAGDFASRLDAWNDVLGQVTRRLPLPSGGLRVVFGDTR
jgi:hypothetical protein